MGRNSRNTRISQREKRRGKLFENHELRRSERVTNNVFSSNKISRKRLTIPLGFFASGIKSTASRGSDSLRTERDSLILNEDLHALLRNLEDGSNERFGRANRAEPVDFPAILPKGTKRKGQDLKYNSVSNYYLDVASKNRAGNEEETSKEGECLQGDITYNQVGFFQGVRFQSTPNETQEKELVPSNNPNPDFIPKEIFDLTIDSNSSINFKFCAKLQAQLKVTRRVHKGEYVLKLKLTARKVNDIFDGKLLPQSLDSSTMSTKRCLTDDYDELPDVPLVPQSQWVYNTPDKRIVKKFVFEDRNEKLVPAVIQTTKKSKVLYDIKNEIAQNVNLNRFKDEKVPIDKRYLNAICQTNLNENSVEQTNAKKKQKVENEENFFNFKAPAEPGTSFFTQTEFKFEKNDFNVFLSNSEETIDIKPSVIVPMDADDSNLFENEAYEKAPIDYRHQLLLATQRPSKTLKRIPKRHMLKGKSLSFENTPPRGQTLGFEPKKLEMSKSLEELDEFETQFNVLGEGSAGLPGAEAPTLQLPAFPTFKFYRRRNYDFNQ